MTAVSRTLFSLLLLVGPAAPALAFHGALPAGYAGLDALFWTYDPAGGDSDSSLGLRLRGGWLANDYLGVEAQLGGGGASTTGNRAASWTGWPAPTSS